MIFNGGLLSVRRTSIIDPTDQMAVTILPFNSAIHVISGRRKREWIIVVVVVVVVWGCIALLAGLFCVANEVAMSF